MLVGLTLMILIDYLGRLGQFRLMGLFESIFHIILNESLWVIYFIKMTDYSFRILLDVIFLFLNGIFHMIAQNV